MSSPKKVGGAGGWGWPGRLKPRGRPELLCPGPKSQREAARGQGRPLGAGGPRTGDSSSGSSLNSCTARCGRGICCVAGRRSWSGKASVSAPPTPSHLPPPPPPPRLPTTTEAPHIPAQGEESGPEATSPLLLDLKSSAGRGRGGRGREGARGSLWASRLLRGLRTESDFSSIQWGQ